jgi:phage terminase large subunit-like protein
VAEYVDGVTSGRIVTGRLARLAVWRYLDDLEKAPKRGFRFDAKCAEEFLDFSELCCHTQGEWAGRPFISEPWQKFIDWNLFGWRREDGTRRFRKDYEELARKQGKTTRCGPKCFYLSIMDNPLEEGAQGYCVATKEDQAKLLFDEIKRCINRSPGLKNYCNVFQRRIVFPSTQSYMQVLGSDSDSQDGFNPHFIVRDELHAWQEKHRGLKEKLETGFGARRQPLTITITTAGDDRSTIWQEEHDYAVRVLESVISGEIIDDSLFAFIAAIDVHPTPCFRCLGPECAWCGGTGQVPADDHFDESVWIKANPNLGVSVKLDRLKEAANEAKNKPSALNQFLRYHCNVRVASTEKAVHPENWAACKGDLSDWSTARVHGGVDLGRSNDMAGVALVAAFDEVDDDGKKFTRYEVRGRAWTCEDRDEDVRTDQIARWIRSGDLEESSDDQVSFTDINDWIVAQTALHGVRTWAFDPITASGPMQRLQEEHGITTFKFTQSPYHYNEVTKLLCERLTTQKHIVNGREVRGITHDGDPVLSWMVLNLIVKRNSRDEWMPDKGSSPQKIDLAVALLMALSECIFSETVPDSQPQLIVIGR